MTYGNEPRRKRSGSSSRRDEAEEADSWLAGLRPSGGRDGEPDPFSAPAGAASSQAFDSNGFEPFDAPPFDAPAPSFDAQPSFDDAPPRGGRRRADDEFTGGVESPSRGLGRRRARDEAEPSGGFPSSFPTFTGAGPTGGGYNGSGAYDAPSMGYRGPAAGPVDSPPTTAFETSTSAFAGDSRAFAGDSRAPRGAEPPYADPPTRTGRRRSRDDAPSYDHGPELTPIIKPLSAYPTQPPTEPPPLTPIFPTLGAKAAPPLGDRAGSERTGSERTGSERTGSLPGRRSFDSSYDAGPESAAPRRPRPRPDEATGPVRTSRSASIHNPAAFARGPVGPAVDQPSGFERPRFDEPRFDEPRFEEPRFEPGPPPRAGRGPAMDETAYAPPVRPPYEPRERDERDIGDFSIGGTRRALQPPDTRPPARSGPRGPRGGGPTIDPVKVGSQHRPHRWIAALSVIGIFVLVAACGLGTYFMIKDERKGPTGARTSGSQGPQERDISSRTVDPAPLTEAEVFPTDSIPSAPNEPPYAVLKTQIGEDCTVAAADDLGKLLVNAGCNQVVRATMKSPNGDYLITAGLFNLRDQQAALDAFNGVKPIIDATKGRFVGMSAGPNTGTDSIVRAPTQLGWNYRGHFIAYCVIARTDGQAFAANDQFPNQITFDVVETYLEGTVIGARAVVQTSSSPGASPAAS